MSENVKKTSYAPLWILIALSALPYIAGTLYYQYKDELPQVKTTNYGKLVEPARELRDVKLMLTDGTEKDISDYRKKWLMLYVLDGACSEDCKKNLYFMRQIRKAMAQERFRISRLVVLDNKDLLTEDMNNTIKAYPGINFATLNQASKQRFYSTIQSDSGNIFRKIMLIDPFGNYMMEYTQDPEPEKVLKDVKRLLSVSRIG